MQELNQNDVIQLKTTGNILFRTAPAGSAVDPNWYWVVIGFAGRDVLACKDGTIIKVPVGDVRRVGSYSLDQVMESLKNVGKEGQIDMPSCISEEMGWKPDRARRFLLRFNLPLLAENEQHKKQILLHLEKLIEDFGDE